MREYMLISVAALLASMLVSCEDSALIEEPEIGRIYVQVLELGTNTPEPGVKVQLPQTGETKETDSNGIAYFVVPAGMHVVRVYGLNHGGPVRIYEEFTVEVVPNGRKVVTLFDCLGCA